MACLSCKVLSRLCAMVGTATRVQSIRRASETPGRRKFPGRFPVLLWCLGNRPLRGFWPEAIIGDASPLFELGMP